MEPEMDVINFGTDGWRAKMDTAFTFKNVQRVAEAFARFIKEEEGHHKVALGFDGRRNSENFALLFARILINRGIEVICSDRITPTPVISYAVINLGCAAGVMITASHNPAEYNGIKFKSRNGSPFSQEQTNRVESLLPADTAEWHDVQVVKQDLLSPYLKHIKKSIDIDLIAQSNLTIAIDSMGGAGGTILQHVLQEAGLEASTIDGVPDEQFAGRAAEPIAQNLAPLSEELKKGDYSVGFATDGDADRLGVMTDQGEWLNIQEVILYLTQYICLSHSHQKKVVKTASVTDKLYGLFEDADDYVVDTQVGFKYVSEAMVAHKAAFGAEESGGFGFREHLPERDGIYSALKFTEMMAKSGVETLSEFVEQKRSTLGTIHYTRIDKTVESPNRHKALKALIETPPAQILGFEVTGTQHYANSKGISNGLKFALKGRPRWLLIRVSETEPLIRVYAEGHTDQEAQQLMKAGEQLFNQRLTEL